MSEAPRNEQQQPAAAPHFLERVIDSAFERATLLEPRLPSLFEPKAVAVAAAVNWPAEIAGSDEEYAAPAQVEDRPEREVQRQTVPSDAPASRELPRADMDPPNESRRRAGPKTRYLVKADQEPEVAANLPARSPARPHEEETDRNVLTPKPLQHLQMTVEARRDWRPDTAHEPERPVLDLSSGVLLAQQVISTTKTIREPTDVSEPMVVREPESREATPRSTERSERLHDHPVAPPPQVHRIVVEPPTARHRAAREPLHAEAATPSPEPIVNVTIGRIEIRAVPAQPGSTRQRGSRPKPMSLDDYLKQRGGGR